VRKLPKSFPFRDIFTEFLEDYSQSCTYWYIPKWRTLNDENVQAVAAILKVIFDEFLEQVWNPATQDRILDRLKGSAVLVPYRDEGSLPDRTALVRISKKLLETLGLLWVENETDVMITDVGLDLLSAAPEDRRRVIEAQIVKYQYPNPSLKGAYAESFGGLLPHVFLLQVLKGCDYRIDPTEYELFVNLAQSQDEVDKVVRFILSWRDISEKHQEEILARARTTAMSIQPDDSEETGHPGTQRRFTRIHQDASYQRAFFAFPGYLAIDDGVITCSAIKTVNEIIDRVLPKLKVTTFRTMADWFAYYGNPKAGPTWLTYLLSLVQDAVTKADMERAKSAVEEHKDLLTETDVASVARAQIEKDIETFYCTHPDLLEKGLVLANDGRQYATPIGRIDMLCLSEGGQYVVVEIKADEARDSVFGQILRYIGWVHRNIARAQNNVRGIILASQFPESARYSRIGLLKSDYQKFIKFKEHGLNVQDT